MKMLIMNCSKKGNLNTRKKESEPANPVKINNISHKPSGNAFLKKVNIFLIILIMILSATLYYTFFDKQGLNNKNNHKPLDDNNGQFVDHYKDREIEPEVPNNNFPLVVHSIIPSRKAGIINGHEHIQDYEQAPKWLTAMDNVGISTTVLLGSPDATFLLKPSGRFNKYRENNEDLLILVQKYPQRFIAFPTIYTYDNDKLNLLKNYVECGAIGLKLFSGHYASFYDVLGPLNHSTMYPVYEYCQNVQIPIIWHVNLGIDSIKAEFENVLKDFPNLIINVPHFMLSSVNLYQTNGQGRLREFLEKYPNLYTDISFGYWVKSGLWRISNNTKLFRDFMIEFQDRFTFGTDMVYTDHPRKNVEWITNLTQGYIDILEKEHFNLTVKDDIEGDFNGDAPGTHNGLNLPKDVLDKIYYYNMIKFLNARLYYENISEIINESNITLQEDLNGKSSNNNYSRANGYQINQGSLIAIDMDSVQFSYIEYFIFQNDFNIQK